MKRVLRIEDLQKMDKEEMIDYILSELVWGKRIYLIGDMLKLFPVTVTFKSRCSSTN